MRLIEIRHGPAGQKDLIVLGVRVCTLRKARIASHGRGNRFNNVPYVCSGIRCYGTNCSVEFGEGCHFANIKVLIGTPEFPAADCHVRIGRNCFAVGLEIRAQDTGSVVEIGEDCMFSHEVVLWASDTHAILDANGEVINASSGIKIGNRVWLGHRVTILKDAVIPDGCIVGAGAVVAGTLGDESNCVYAGVPARIVKRGVTWDRRPASVMGVRNASIEI